MENEISGRQLGTLLVAVGLVLLGYVGLTGTLSLRLVFGDIFFIVASVAAFYFGKCCGKKEYYRE